MRHGARLAEVYKVLVAHDARSVLDLGCGDGQLLELLAEDSRFIRLAGLDIDDEALDTARNHIKPRNGLELQVKRGSLLEASSYSGFDAVTMIDVIEHLAASDLKTLEKVVFNNIRPRLFALTTPEIGNANGSHHHGYSHHEHEFEWSFAEADKWASGASKRYGYQFDHQLVSTKPLRGKDIQLIVFWRT